jgi:hypothetical protein
MVVAGKSDKKRRCLARPLKFPDARRHYDPTGQPKASPRQGHNRKVTGSNPVPQPNMMLIYQL